MKHYLELLEKLYNKYGIHPDDPDEVHGQWYHLYLHLGTHIE